MWAWRLDLITSGWPRCVWCFKARLRCVLRFLLSGFRHYLNISWYKTQGLRQRRARVCLTFHRPEWLFVLRRSRGGRHCLVLAQGQSQRCYVSLSFCCFSLSLLLLHVFLNWLLPLCQSPSSIQPPLPITAFTVGGEAIQLWKCCETSDSTSCSNQYISGPADTHTAENV